MRLNTKNNSRRNGGIALIWTAITLIVLILFVGLAIDVARIYLAAHQLQNAADAAALAGARYVAWDPNSETKIEARLKALEYANYNYAANLIVNLNLTTNNGGEAIQGIPLPANRDHPGDIIIGRFISQTRTFIPTLDTPNAMKVVTRKQNGQANVPLPLLFGPIVHVDDVNIQGCSTAMIYNSYEPAVICCCDASQCIYLHGNPVVNVNQGSVVANSIAVDAVDVRGKPAIYASEFNVSGDVTISGNYDFDTDLTYNDIPATLNKGVPPIPCPYADCAEPAIAGISPTAPPDGNTLHITSGTWNLEPGYYPGGIEISGDAVVNLARGIYQVNGTATSGGLSITGGTTIALEVMFHIVGGKLDIRGNAQLTLTPRASESCEFISIFQSRSNYSQAEINGTGDLDITGSLYFPNNHIYITGDGDTIGSRIVACTIEFAGNGEINVGYSASPKITNKSFLVE
jgi:hypothetical protein